MASHLTRIKFACLIAFLAAAPLAARADEPTPAAIEAARLIIIGSGMTRSLDLVIPQAFGTLERTVETTRPELKEPLHQTLLALVPEFARTERDVVDKAALAMARRMSEQELKDTAAFFASPSGKKYVASEPETFNDIVNLVQTWRQQLSTDVLTRAREEMKKKGLDF